MCVVRSGHSTADFACRCRRRKARCPKSAPKEADNEGALPLHWVPWTVGMTLPWDLAMDS